MNKETLPLTMIPSGSVVTLVAIQGGQGLRRRLTDMGLNEGLTLKVLQSHSRGSCVLLAGDTRLVLGHGMADKILVERVRTVGKKITIALAGNPNSGKTTIFNNLTGSLQRVGNYPGVTVEKKEGNLTYKGYTITVVDLPGTYSLTAHSVDELVARNFVIEEKPDVVIDIVDTSNLERNLYLATQFMELEVPLVLAFNMHDLAQKQGLAIERPRLSELLGAPIVFTVAHKRKGMNELLDEAIKLVEGKSTLQRTQVGYGKEIDEEIKKIKEILRQDQTLIRKYNSQWLAIKLLENDSEVIDRLGVSPHKDEILNQMQGSIHHLQGIFGDFPEAIIADRRYGFISGACSEVLRRNYEIRHSISDKIDRVLINRFFGLPIFLLLVWVMFKFTFTFSEPLMEGIEAGQQWLESTATGFLSEGSALQSLIVDGIIAGVGSVLVFVPIIFLLFLAMAFLEDSGYMARAAFIMDKFMHKIGLHGRSFIPLLLGFGCNVPAIMATRTIADRKDRLVTLLIIPFMSCGARLPVYTLFIGAFFPERIAGNVLFSLYILGLMVAIIMAKIFRKYFLKGEAAAFVMELPPYRLPTLKALLTHTWERGVVYLKKAGTIIFAGCVIIWFLCNFPFNPGYSKDYKALIVQAHDDKALIAQLENQMAYEKLEKSYAGTLGRAIEPLLKPLGFGDWKMGTALIGGLAAKEIVVATLGTLYAVGGVDEKSQSLRYALRHALRPDGSHLFSPLVAYSLMVFILLYVPCIAVIAVIRQETQSWLWPLCTILYTTLVAWIVSFIIYQGGRMIGLG